MPVRVSIRNSSTGPDQRDSKTKAGCLRLRSGQGFDYGSRMTEAARGLWLPTLSAVSRPTDEDLSAGTPGKQKGWGTESRAVAA
ncbi:MAG TPA: hypothetical protein VMR02_03125 [Terracidiphilus sp.]|jgi:hypothetical protein|nr:hypothetical protein [Terracidiphilus sp.]